MIKVNGKEIEFQKFPNNEILLKNQFAHIMDKFKIIIKFKYENDSDLIKLMLLKKRIDEIFTGQIILKIVYMPYSRMDRGDDEIVFTLKYVAEFINQLKFNTVIIYEPHSDKCLELINNSIAKYYTPEILKDVVADIDPNYILFPDKGALTRYSNMFRDFDIPIINADKKRDFSTGKIKNLEIIGEFDKNSTIVIIDDLSSFGGTFLWASQKLKEKGAGKIFLIVGHAEYSIMMGDIPESNLIDQVFTTNSIINKEYETDKIKIKGVI